MRLWLYKNITPLIVIGGGMQMGQVVGKDARLV